MTNISEQSTLPAFFQSNSNMVKRYAERFPTEFSTITANLNTEAKIISFANIQATLKRAQTSEQDFAQSLRLTRWQQHVRLACADMAGKLTAESMIVTLSELADLFLQVTYDYCYSDLVKRFGTPMSRDGTPQHLTMFGMGKLGGRELNFSSDVDLIALFDQAGETDGERCIDNALFFHKLMQKFIVLLDKRDANGFAYRIDMRLKPFGQVGSLVSTFESTRKYYLEHGRDWERYALVKMRPVAGDIDAGNEFIDSMQAWTYRRNIDFNSLWAIDEMKQQILTRLSDEGLERNVKLGIGGIRDIEFIVQTKQLMFGGRIQALRGQSILRALSTLAEHDILSTEVVATLREHYLFLRRVENAIQYYDDKQTHDLPDKAEQKISLCNALGFTNWQTLTDTLRHARYEVSTQFSRIFARRHDDTETVFENIHDVKYWLSVLNESDIQDKHQVAKRFATFYQSIYTRDDAHRYLVRLDWLMPMAIDALSAKRADYKLVNRALLFFDAILEENVYISLIIENSAVLATLLQLLDASEWLANFVCAHPSVIDELIHAQFETTQKTASETHADLAHAVAQAQTTEQKIQQLISHKNAQLFRIASADLRGDMTLMEVSDHLTWVAEATCQAVLYIAEDELQTRYGKPTYQLDGKTHEAGFGIVGYGKFGGIEMGYNSDLDLLFLYHSAGDKQETDGEKSVPNEVYFTKLVQKITGYLTTSTANGRMYDVDQRLRPSGNAGLPVSSLSAFERYQQHDAWVWEHQALVRSRFICGDETVKEGFKAIRESILCQPRDKAELSDAVVTMREKMIENRKQFTDFNIKYDRGGVIDIEFIVQYLVLLNAQHHRHLVRCSDNIRQISALELFDIIPSSQATDLREIYRQYREFIHHAQLRHESAVVNEETFVKERSKVTAFWISTLSQ